MLACMVIYFPPRIPKGTRWGMYRQHRGASQMARLPSGDQPDHLPTLAGGSPYGHIRDSAARYQPATDGVGSHHPGDGTGYVDSRGGREVAGGTSSERHQLPVSMMYGTSSRGGDSQGSPVHSIFQ